MEDRILLQMLRTAVREGDLNRMTSLLRDYHGEVEPILNEPRNQFMHDACRFGHEQIVIQLTGYTDDINADSPEGPPLTIACRHGYMSIVDVLFTRSDLKLDLPLTMDADQKEIQKCPFHEAAASGWTEILEALFEQRPEALQQNACMESILLSACSRGHDCVMEYCWRMTSCDLSQSLLQRLVDIACHGNFPNVLRLLVSKGAHITADLLLRYHKVVTEMLSERVSKLTEAQEPSLLLNWDAYNLQALHSDFFTEFNTQPLQISLCDNLLTALLNVVPWGLPNLVALNLKGNQLVCLDPPLKSEGIICHSLAQLNLSHNRLRSVPVELFHIPSLRTLDLSHNHLEFLPPLSEKELRVSKSYFYVGSGSSSFDLSSSWLTSELCNLDLSHNCLKRLPNQLQVCEKLQHLNVSFNSLGSFPSPWQCPLKSLDLSHNRLDDLSEGWDNCWTKTLNELNLSSNALMNINQSVCRLSELYSLNLSSNQLMGLPPVEWWLSQNLTHLDLSSNRIKYIGKSSSSNPRKIFRIMFPSRNNEAFMASPSPGAHTSVKFPVKLMKNSLISLNLSRNHLREIPPSIYELTSLNRLDISHNTEMTFLPLDLTKLKKLQTLCIDGLSISNLPKNLQRGSVLYKTKSILANLKHQLRRSVPYYGMKLMLVGSEGTGKTTLSACLRGKPPPKHNVATVGVEMADWRLHGGDSMRQKLKDSSSRSESFPDINFCVWDFAGQKEFTVTHKVFLSRYGLYLLLFDLRTHAQGIRNLRSWLLDIRAHAEKSQVIIVGTHLDCLTDRSSIGKLHAQIREEFTQQDGYPSIKGFFEVSCSKGTGLLEGIEELKVKIYETARKIEVYIPSQSSKETLIGRKIPKSYLDLQKLIIAEAKRRREQRNEWLCLSRDEYHTLIRSNAENDIASDEDVDLATQFLHEAGTLLYYGHHSEDMRQLYFIDPSWLAQTLAKFITLQASQNFVKDGILSLKKALPVLLKTREDISIQIISVLEAFNIALKLDDDRLLISSKLLNEKPPIQLHPATDAAASRVQRLYQMRYTPSGFWCRLITQILAMLNRFSSKSKADCHIYSMVSDSAVKTTYWQQGLRVDWPTGYACVESADSVWQCKDGLHITVSDSGGNFSWLGFFVDQVDSLIYQWYPGLSHDPSLEDSHCHILIPCPKCTSPESPHFFLLVDCVLSVVQGAMEITCVECSSAVPLSKLIPDVLLDDLPPSYVLAKERLDFNPDEGFLGAGAEGVVYKAVLDGRTAVAVKQSVLMRVVSYVHGANSSHSSSSSNSSGTTTEQLRSRLMPVCSSIRHEVGLMCGLQHPCIVSLLGVCMPILSYALEMAPLGSLRSVLNEKSKGFSGGQSCGLGSLLSFRVVYQIALGLSYLHSEAIVYKDMKADNILIWSLNPNDKNSVNVKLSDYGLSQYVGPQGLTGFEGTVGYQAPEMNHNAVYDNKIDIFACGMVIYEVMTGSYPFEQMPSIAVPHAIQDGERPKVKNEGIWMPHMISLMKQCWAQNPNERPSADDIISRMAREDFYALHAAYQQEALPVTCVLAIPDQMYLRFWTWCVDSHCEYHVFDTKNGLFKAQGEHLKGAAVNCMLWLRSSEVIVAQDEELKLLSLEPTTGGIIVLSTLQCSASPLRLLLCKPDSEASDEPQSFMASLSNGQIVSVAIAKKKLKMRVSLPLDKHPITALSFVESRRELWISCEHQVIILNPYLEIIDKFQLTGLRENRFIKDIVTQDDRVWVISNGSSVVYEYDVETRQELCQFNFGREVWPGAMVLSFVEDFAENGDPITVVMDNINHPQYRRKRSFRRSKKKSQSESTPTVNIRSLRIRSVLFVHGTLWVATSKGSIVVVNVTENNSHLVDYGQVLGVFKPTQATVGIVSVSLLPDNLCAVVSQEPPSSDDDRLPVLITVWRAFTLEEWAENTDFFKRMKLREEYCLSKWKNAKTASRTLSNPL